MLKAFRVRNFKSFQDSGAVELAPLTVLFGPNTAGKSNFIDALMLASRLASERTLSEAFGGPIRGRTIEAFRFGELGLPELLDRPKTSLDIEVTIAPAGPAEHLRYRAEIALNPRSGELLVEDEYLATLSKSGEPKGLASIERVSGHFHVRRKGQGSRPYKVGRGSYTQLSDRRFSGKGHEPIARCRDELSSWRAYYLDPRVAMRSAQSPQEVVDIGPLGEFVASFLYRLKNAQAPKHYDAVKRALRMIIPSVDDLIVDLNLQRGEIELTIVQDGIAYPARVVSEGTLRVLALSCIAVNPYGGSLVAFEEPENGVHPRRIELIAELLVNMVKRGGRQIIVTTHSPVFCGTLFKFLRESPRALRSPFRTPPIRMYSVIREDGASKLKPFSVAGPLFDDDEVRRALTDPTDEKVFEAAMVRGLLDG